MNFAEQVEGVIRATAFHPSATFSWFGKLSPKIHRSLAKSITPDLTRKYLAHSLETHLYAEFYCRGHAQPAREDPVARLEVGRTSFARRLSAASAGNGFFSDEWILQDVKGSDLLVSRGGLELWVRERECRLPQDSAIRPGTHVALLFPKELFCISPGFYVALGDNELTDPQPHALVRLYWNLTPAAAVTFIRKATRGLNACGLPFKIKAINDEVRYTRRDAVVLYVRKADYGRVSAVIEKVYSQVVDGLKDGVPAFTKALATGVGLAEDPGTGDSFGLHRCRILADALIRAHEEKKISVDERLQLVRKCFAENGIDLNRPYLTFPAIDEYMFNPRVRRRPRASGKPAVGECGPSDFLQASAAIAERFAREAVWSGDRCNWMGTVQVEPEPGKTPGRHYRALGPDFYSGTSGVAVFLAELYAATGHVGARRCALGAIRQAFSVLDSVDPGSRLGLYSGWTGIALAAAWVGNILREPEFLERAARLMRRSEYVQQRKCDFDVISGRAGAINGLLAVRELTGDESLVDLASGIGRALLRSAQKAAYGWSWPSAARRNYKNLTGFAHGTAGAAFALLELFRATGDALCREGAEQAIQYERHWFDKDARNWPDFRKGSGESRWARGQCSNAWCHGAPGIALTRIRAYQILKDAVCRGEALVALQTTLRSSTAMLRSDSGEYCLCHGLSGNAEILLHGSQVLGQDFVAGVAIAKAVANAGIAVQTPARWLAEGPPGLMLGAAGIGCFYLRMSQRPIRSVLTLSRENTEFA